MLTAVSRSEDHSRTSAREYLLSREQGLTAATLHSLGRAGLHADPADIAVHFRFLCEGIRPGAGDLFLDYLDWAKVRRAASLGSTHQLAAQSLEPELRHLRHAIADATPTAISRPAVDLLESAISLLPLEPAGSVPEPLGEDPLAAPFLNLLLNGDQTAAEKLIFQALDNGLSVRDLYLRVFEPSQRRLGRLWQCNLVTIGQEHFCTAATQQIISLLYPRIFHAASKSRRMMGLTVSGDLHEIGIRMISDLFELDDWDTRLLPANLPPERIGQIAAEWKPHILAISVTMGYHLGAASQVIGRVKSDPACSHTKIIVGGYPFNVAPDLWRSLGADGWAPDAAAAVALGCRLFSGKPAS